MSLNNFRSNLTLASYDNVFHRLQNAFVEYLTLLYSEEAMSFVGYWISAESSVKCRVGRMRLYKPPPSEPIDYGLLDRALRVLCPRDFVTRVGSDEDITQLRGLAALRTSISRIVVEVSLRWRRKAREAEVILTRPRAVFGEAGVKKNIKKGSKFFFMFKRFSITKYSLTVLPLTLF